MTPSDEGKVDYTGKQQKLRDGIVKNLNFLGLDGAIITSFNFHSLFSEIGKPANSAGI